MTHIPAIAQVLAGSVPMIRTLNLEFVETDQRHAVLRLPDQPAFHNHIGGPHAGAMFTLAESASGAIVMGTFGGEVGRATTLAVRAEIDFRMVAMGPLTAEAALSRPASDVIAELDAGQRPEFSVVVTLRTDDGTVTGEMTIVWTLRPHR